MNTIFQESHPPTPPSALRYHKTNSGLDLLISNLKLKQDGLQQEVLTQRTGKSDAEQLLKRMQHDLQAVIPYIQVCFCVCLLHYERGWSIAVEGGWTMFF